MTQQTLTPETLTQQSVFNAVVQHLLKQGKKSLRPDLAYDAGEGCAYLSPQGLKCAVGCLVRPDEYNPDMEGNSVGNILELLPGRLRAHVLLLASLQRIHDLYPVACWPLQLRILAVESGLDVSALPDLTAVPA